MPSPRIFTAECKVCHKTIAIPKQQVGIRKYCSRKCEYEDRKEAFHAAGREKAIPKLIARNKARADTPWIKELKRAFYSHRQNAHTRNIPWELTFAQWLQIWVESGHLAERGLGHNKYCMARNGDIGPYSITNVKIVTTDENLYDRVINNRLPKGHDHHNAKLTEDKVRYIRKNPDNLTTRQLSELFEVGLEAIQRVRNGTRWAHVPDDPPQLIERTVEQQPASPDSQPTTCALCPQISSRAPTITRFP
jgi:hypothetical protein